MSNVSVSLSLSLAVGVKLYAAPVVAVVAGVPLMVGAAFGVILMEKAGSATMCKPSLTDITMFDHVLPMTGVPVSAPVAVLKAAQDGLFWMLNVKGSLSASLAVGVKL